MINYWWVTRPKRSLSPVPEVLGLVTCEFLDKQWRGSHSAHLDYEAELEQNGLKRKGDRRDQGGGGGRTYLAWLQSLGLVFYHGKDKILKPTLAGDALLQGKSPTEVLTRQVLNYQFPSAFSLGRNVQVASRFKIRPFRFLLRLLLDTRIEEKISEEEIAKIVAVEAENESDKCYEHVVSRILEFREKGDACLPSNFDSLYSSTRSKKPLENLIAVANTMANWLSYTQFVSREGDVMTIPVDKRDSVLLALQNDAGLIKCPQNHENFQRQYGLDPWHHKDTRNMAGTSNVTSMQIGAFKIQQTLLRIATQKPINTISASIVNDVSEATGYNKDFVEDTLYKIFPAGALESFYSAYTQMAVNGLEDCISFEKATAQLFDTIFGFKTKHVGQVGLSPDVLIVSDDGGYQAIVDNKAYQQYSITNDHKNRMCVNYINDLAHYSDCAYPLVFFSYIAGGFVSNISAQISNIAKETGVHGSAISASTLVSLCKMHSSEKYSHSDLRQLFSVDRRINITDITTIKNE